MTSTPLLASSAAEARQAVELAFGRTDLVDDVGPFRIPKLRQACAKCVGFRSRATTVHEHTDPVNLAEALWRVRHARSQEPVLRLTLQLQLGVCAGPLQFLSITMFGVLAYRVRHLRRFTTLSAEIFRTIPTPHRDGRHSDGQPSLSGDCGHGWACRLPRPVTN